MAHFAKISEENIVLQVLTLNNSDMLDSNNIENESIGQEYLEKHNNWPRHLWIQTSYNTINNQHRFNGTPFRGNFAGIGYTWDEQNQIFWPPKPYSSWSKNIQIGTWQSPIGPRPEETQEMINNKQYYIWNENSTSWDIYSRPVQI